MPEGDTIFRAAETLHRVFAGQVVTRFESVFPLLNRVADDRPLEGRGPSATRFKSGNTDSKRVTSRPANTVK